MFKSIFIASAVLAIVTAQGGGEKGHEHDEKYIDYYGHPVYKFDYHVFDPKTKDQKRQWEERDGDNLKGFYTFVQPDNLVRNVHYTADKNGFQAHVTYEKPGGKALLFDLADHKVKGAALVAVKHEPLPVFKIEERPVAEEKYVEEPQGHGFGIGKGFGDGYHHFSGYNDFAGYKSGSDKESEKKTEGDAFDFGGFNHGLHTHVIYKPQLHNFGDVGGFKTVHHYEKLSPLTQFGYERAKEEAPKDGKKASIAFGHNQGLGAYSSDGYKF